ncbi:OmpA family protein [Mucilaginibacter sp. ZB1P21]|uniref:OmpA family protein n=2 Tax=Mucilaginibacter glaciei TaxID=2772109 RepID=A0A926NU78_9SPHI|nr:OmpA family protein [Mucilaginibacter glaciei]
MAALPACKSKKVVQKAAPVVETPAPAAAPKPVPQPDQSATAQPAPPPIDKPDYNFKNIQFEFNSGILKTEAYPILDKAAAEMKKDPSVKFVLNGNSSAEGTDEHNMTLSVERANSVKTYLVNTGVNADILIAKGFGESKPIADNKTEAGRMLNRRVEIKKQ